MPVIRIDIGKQSINDGLKKQLIEKITETAVEITQIPKIAFSVIINEHDDANYGVGGETVDKIRNK